MSNNNSSAEQGSSRSGSPIIYWVIIALLLAACIFLFMSKNQMAEQDAADKQNLEAKIDSVSSDRESLQKDFEAASAKIDQLVTENARLDSSLQMDNSELVALKSKIKGILGKANVTKVELKKAQELITSLNSKTAQYEARIAELEKENEVLTGKNVVLTKERDSTVTQNIAIKKLASVLHASNISLEPIHLKRNGKERETSKAKKVDVLRMKFDIDENRIAENGNRMIYVRIIASGGNTLNSAANGSGNLTTNKGDVIAYSMVKEIALVKEQPVKNLSLDWKQEGDYTPGNYMIEIYNEGFKIGSGNVTLK
jgi:outer membrane murein-binding lipoprotein Lpp